MPYEDAKLCNELVTPLCRMSTCTHDLLEAIGLKLGMLKQFESDQGRLKAGPTRAFGPEESADCCLGNRLLRHLPREASCGQPAV